MRHILTSAFVLTVAGTSAFSGTLEVTPDPVVVPPTPVSGDWAGAYAGVQLGFADLDITGAPAAVGANAPLSGDDGFLFGVHAGYNWDRGSFVYGVEGDIDFPDVSFGTTDVDNIARLRLRMGVDANRAFVYATGGAAHLSGSGGGVSLDGWGWVAGAGVDFKVNEDWVVGADALYHEFDDVSPTGKVDGATYRLRASFRF